MVLNRECSLVYTLLILGILDDTLTTVIIAWFNNNCLLKIKPTDTIPSPIRVVKPGSIKEPDSLFNQLAKNIGDKYKQVGIDLGLTFMDLHNQLETGHTLMLPANEKALKMLMLWRDNSLEKDFTYVILATALENHGLTSFADKHCYMDHSGRYI